MKKQIFTAMLLFSTSALAETLYTNLEDTPVQEKPVAGAPVLIHLPAGSMIETAQTVGAFVAISFIDGGKVKNGFVMADHLGASSPAAGASSKAVAQDPAIVGVSKIESFAISETDLLQFAANGKLVPRNPKGKSR